MSLLQKVWDAKKYLLPIGLISIVFGLSWSHALVSIGVGICTGHWVLHLKGKPDPDNRFYGVFLSVQLLLMAWVGLSFFWSADPNGWASVFTRKLPLLLLPLVCWRTYCLSRAGLLWVTGALIFGLLLTDLSTLGYYLSNFAAVNESFLHSKSLPVLFFGYQSSSSHIYLGVLNTLGLVACFWLYQQGWKRWIFVLTGIFFFLFIHILSSRTGLLSLYGMLGVGILHLILSKRKYKAGLLALGLLLLIPLVAYWTLPSFQNRVKDTIHDITFRQRGQSNNHMSVSMRFEAWQTSWQIWQQHFWTGVGASDIKAEMEQQYIANKSELYPENRILPHNQYLETGATYGLPGFLLFLGGLLSIVLSSKNWRNPYMVLIWSVFLFAFCFESLLEREFGIVAYALYPLLAFQWYKTEKA